MKKVIIGARSVAGSLVAMFLILALACGGDKEVIVEDLPDPGLSNSAIAETMKQNPGVLDAAVSKQGNQVSLVLIVVPLTNEGRAKQLGENFVRLFKSLSDDESPGRSIDRGKYDYLIGVYYPNEKKVVQGAKSRASDRISW